MLRFRFEIFLSSGEFRTLSNYLDQREIVYLLSYAKIKYSILHNHAFDISGERFDTSERGGFKIFVFDM